MDFITGKNDAPKAQPPATNVSDVELAQKSFQIYHEQIAVMVGEANAVVVDSEQSCSVATGMVGDAKKLYKQLEDQRKEIVAKPNQFVKAVNTFVKQFTTRLSKEVEATLKRKIGDFQYKRELERRKQEEAIRKANLDLQKKLDEEAAKSGVEAPQVGPVSIPREEGVVSRSDSGASASIRMKWTGDIEDEKKVPREYCSPDQKKIDDAVKMGTREIPGVKIYEKPITVVRT